MTNNNEFMKETLFAITISDINGKIIYMNDKAKITFKNEGGANLIGKSLYDCHSQNSISIIQEIMKTGIPHTYSIEKKGIHKIIHQSPLIQNGLLVGIMELSIEVPPILEHFNRD
jgi:transcriptional regulator with PAS, ATPase and Fis domain